MYVVGTAGHVDHGKSTLVEALTGIDPDRLKEEKERGMTIDLGFAWLQLPGGNEVSIIDVPGHERFVNNMLAGVGGIDLRPRAERLRQASLPQVVGLEEVRLGVEDLEPVFGHAVRSWPDAVVPGGCEHSTDCPVSSGCATGTGNRKAPLDREVPSLSRTLVAGPGLEPGTFGL